MVGLVSTELSKGANAPVPTAELTVEVSWQAAPGMELDASALLLTEAGKVRSDEDFIFYNQPASADGSVKHAGSLPGGGDRLVVDAGRAAGRDRQGRVHGLDPQRGQYLLQVGGAKIAVLQGGQPVVSYAISGLTHGDRASSSASSTAARGRGSSAPSGRATATGLKGIATEFGISVDDDPAPAPPPRRAAPAAAAPIDLNKKRAIDLRKQVESSSPVLLKKFDAAQVSLEKKGLLSERAEVVLVLDVSGSSRSLFRSGAYQVLIDRFVAAALLFDDNGTLDTWLFDHRLHEAEAITMANREGWTDRQLARKDIWGMTEYAKPIDKIADGLVARRADADLRRLHHRRRQPRQARHDQGHPARLGAARVLPVHGDRQGQRLPVPAAARRADRARDRQRRLLRHQRSAGHQRRRVLRQGDDRVPGLARGRAEGGNPRVG